MKNIFIIYNYIWLLSVVLILFRRDRKEMLTDVFDFFSAKDILGTFICIMAVYVYLPFTILRSIENILNINNDDGRNDK